MSKDGRKTSKLAIAGLTLAVAAPCLFFISALALARFYEELNGALIIFMLLLLLLPFAAFPLSIAGLIITIAKKKKGRAAAITGLVLSVAEILFVIVTAGAFLTYEKNPGHSLDIVPPYIGTSAPTETSETTARMLIGTSGTKQLTLDDVIELSSKGEELVWEDLSDYKGVETGSGLYIVTYKIDENYELMVGGTGAVGKPMYAHLIYVDDEYVDIMTDDVEAFIAENS